MGCSGTRSRPSLPGIAVGTEMDALVLFMAGFMAHEMLLIAWSRHKNRKLLNIETKPKPRAPICGIPVHIPVQTVPCQRQPGHAGPCDEGWVIRVPNFELSILPAEKEAEKRC